MATLAEFMESSKRWGATIRAYDKAKADVEASLNPQTVAAYDEAFAAKEEAEGENDRLWSDLPYSARQIVEAHKGNRTFEKWAISLLD